MRRLRVVWRTDYDEDIFATYIDDLIELNPKRLTTVFRKVRALTHELVHYFTDKLRLPSIFENIIDYLDCEE